VLYLPRDHTPRATIHVVYERKWCFNWFVARKNGLGRYLTKVHNLGLPHTSLVGKALSNGDIN